MLRVVALFVLLAQFAGAANAPYYRFWQGNKRNVWYNDANKAFTYQDFIQKLNQWLIPATTSCCAKESLLAYVPVVPPMEKSINGLHDEYAIIVYRSEEIYNKVRTNPNDKEALVYGPLHANVFEMGDGKNDPNSSRSAVPLMFTGTVDLSLDDSSVVLKERAYDVLGSSVDWQKGFTVFRVITRGQGMDDREYEAVVAEELTRVKADSEKSGLLGDVVLIDREKIVEYQNWTHLLRYYSYYEHRDLPETLDFVWDVSVAKGNRIHKDPLAYRPVTFGHGLSVQFTPGIKPGQVRHPLLDK